MKQLSSHKALNKTLSAIYNHAAIVGAKIPVYQADAIIFGKTNDRERKRSKCCNATIEGGCCSDCWTQID
jgi:hypothetical protein